MIILMLVCVVVRLERNEPVGSDFGQNKSSGTKSEACNGRHY